MSANPTVLVVDDEPAVRVALKAILAEHFNVVACSSGVEAVAFVSTHPAQVATAFVDYAMPHMNGNEVCAALRSLDATICLIGFSGHEAAPFDGPLFAILTKKHLNPERVLAVAAAATQQRRKSDDSAVESNGHRVT